MTTLLRMLSAYATTLPVCYSKGVLSNHYSMAELLPPSVERVICTAFRHELGIGFK